MKKSILEIYALAVCFAAVVCFVIVAGISLYNIIEITNPAFTLSAYEHSRHQSNDEFRKSRDENCSTTNKDTRRLTEEELTKRRMESYKLELVSEQRSALQSLTKAVIAMLLDIIFFIAHWRIARRAREANNIA